MINTFMNFFSGPTKVQKTINGRLCTYYYSGKPAFFDPVQMLTDLNFRFQDQSVQRLPYQFADDPIQSLISLPGDFEKPAVTCHLTLNKKALDVKRYVFKISGSPASYYQFDFDGEEILRFIRFYQMSSFHQNLGLKLATVHKDNLDLSRSQWSWERGDGKVLFLENFGYPQLWKIDNINELKNMIK